ncbi:polyprenyl synthetase [Colletotrichum orchidophilum]|uniref:Polyprenyl synthetase n=1 Tax=Colletotrichum orchidophilum TaxID=1209926 RepID=A0A1G4B2G5_9PEZI|nr:polyprenyl synthetase [Colletotrichum orchidophilum]OHE95567.1 polyprenyl synthetase [Colletotrichum orchidophilum]
MRQSTACRKAGPILSAPTPIHHASPPRQNFTLAEQVPELHHAAFPTHASSVELEPTAGAPAAVASAGGGETRSSLPDIHKKPRFFPWQPDHWRRLPFAMVPKNPWASSPSSSPLDKAADKSSDPTNNNPSSTFPHSPPNHIPSRKSSIGHQSAAAAPVSLSAHAAAPMPATSKAPLRTVPETDWLSRANYTNTNNGHGHGHGHSHAHKHSLSHSSRRSRRPSLGNNLATSFTLTMQPPPPPDPSRYATSDLNFTRKTWPEEKDKVITGPFDYLYTHPGKDFRAQLIQAFNVWLEVPQDSIDVITNVVGMLHTASLLIDDVEDSSSLRRGLPVAHNIFGVAQTINSANYIYFCALQELQRLKNPKTISIFAEELVHLHRGQGMDLFWRDTLTCPTEEDYLEMVGNKTGGLFRLGVKLMQAESRSLTDCSELVNLMGLIFQIRDDYMNLSSKEYSDNKGMCEDLTEGKFSFPIIHSIRSDPSNLQLINILGQKTNDVEVKRFAVARMESTGSFEYTKQVVGVLIARARTIADDIDEGRGLTKGVHKILDKMVLADQNTAS